MSTLVLSQGTQFITGACTSDADCASGCCGFNSGKCAGAVIAQERDGGCGFGDSSPNDNAAVALGFTGVGASGTSSNSGASSGTSSGDTSSSSSSSSSAGTSSNGAGTQFITGACSSDADCASGCCGFNSGKCAGAIVAQERDGGCGFGDSSPNDDAAVALGFTGSAPTGSSSGSTSGSTSGMTGASSDTSSPGGSSSSSSTSSTSGAGNGNGAQFITGPCDSDADCASGCCGFNSGKCAGAVIAQERDGGCGFGDGQPNDDAAQAFRANQRRWSSYDYRREE